MRLTISLLTLLLLGTSWNTFASEAPADCKTAATTLRAGIESRPDDLLIFFDDAIKSSPECVRLLMTTAVEVSKPDDELLKQIIHVALTEYPEKQSLIAEVAMELAPDSAMAIREAFVSSAEPVEEKPVVAAKVSPVDRFLGGGGVREENFSPLSVDANHGVVDAIARLSTQIGLEQQEQTVDSSFKFKRPDHIQVTDHSAEVEEQSLRDSSPLDTHEEEMEEGEAFSLVLLDEGQTQSDAPAAFAAAEVKEAAVQENADPAPDHSPAPEIQSEPTDLASLTSTSSIYFIPSAGGKDFSGSQRNEIVLRSMPAAPTMPRLR